MLCRYCQDYKTGDANLRYCIYWCEPMTINYDVSWRTFKGTLDKENEIIFLRALTSLRKITRLRVLPELWNYVDIKFTEISRKLVKCPISDYKSWRRVWGKCWRMVFAGTKHSDTEENIIGPQDTKCGPLTANGLQTVPSPLSQCRNKIFFTCHFIGK
jgi:hypothetical protein